MKIPTLKINFGKHSRQLERLITDNSPTILTGIGVIGIGATAVLTWKATKSAESVLADKRAVANANRSADEDYVTGFTKAETFAFTWKFYIAPVCTGVLTAACVVAANHINTKRAAAIAAVLAMTQDDFKEYREKAKEKMTGPKHKEMEGEIAQEKVNRILTNTDPIIIGEGELLCIELWTGQTFTSTREKIQRAENDLNRRIIQNDAALLAEFYDMLKIEHNDQASKFGWNTTQMCEIDFKPVFDKDGKPALGIVYETEPIHQPWEAASFTSPR